jgi:Tesmin/TSO1-like CXC domain, cysteine-rich domain
MLLLFITVTIVSIRERQEGALQGKYLHIWNTEDHQYIQWRFFLPQWKQCDPLVVLARRVGKYGLNGLGRWSPSEISFLHVLTSFLMLILFRVIRCLKLYCQCFASSTTCGPTCKCQGCHNTSQHGDSIESARRTILERNPSAFDDKFRLTMSHAAAAMAAGNAAMNWLNQNGGYSHHAPQQMPMHPPSHFSLPHHGPPPPPPPQHHHHMHHGPPQAPHAPMKSPSPPRHLSRDSEQQEPPAPQTMLTTPLSSTSSAHRPYRSNTPRVSPPQMMPAIRQSPQTLPPTRMNKYGCKCRRSFCLKKVRLAIV